MLWAGMSSILVAPYPHFPGLDIKEGFIGLFVRIAFLLFVEHDNKDKNLLRKESRAGGLVRLRGSVGGAARGQSGGSLLAPVCHRVGLSRRLADVNGQSAGGSDGVDGLPDTWSERGWRFAMCRKMCKLATWN